MKVSRNCHILALIIDTTHMSRNFIVGLYYIELSPVCTGHFFYYTTITIIT